VDFGADDAADLAVRRVDASRRIRFDLGRGGPGGWWIIAEPGIELPNTPEISPDIGGWRRYGACLRRSPRDP